MRNRETCKGHRKRTPPPSFPITNDRPLSLLPSAFSYFQVPCTIITPIAPLSLSFRPLVVPESSHIMVVLPTYARSSARVSFDGKDGESRHVAYRGGISGCQTMCQNQRNYGKDGEYRGGSTARYMGRRNEGGKALPRSCCCHSCQRETAPYPPCPEAALAMAAISLYIYNS